MKMYNYDFSVPVSTRDENNLIPELGKGLQKYNNADDESVDPTNTLGVFKKEIWPYISQNFNSKSHVLDVGAGNGRFSSFIASHVDRVVAIDAFRELSDTHKRKNIEYQRTTFQDYEGPEFDVIFLFGVMYLQESWGLQEALDKMALKLKPQGVIITVDDKKRDLSSHPTKQLPAGFYNLNELCASSGLNRIEDFIQANNVHRITTLQK